MWQTTKPRRCGVFTAVMTLGLLPASSLWAMAPPEPLSPSADHADPHSWIGPEARPHRPAHRPPLVGCLEDAWHTLHVEFLSDVFWHSSSHPRFRGLGEPLISSSWRNRPFHVGWFVGPLLPDAVTRGSRSEDASLFGGYRLGWDFDHYWGAEWRIGWTRPEIFFPDEPTSRRRADLTVTDLNVLYYPWGDSVVRPYALLGLGVTALNFRDEVGLYHDETLASIPLGAGVKHHYRRWLSLRLELLDNIALGSGSARSMHNVSLTFGVEVHFGVRPRSYFPWNPSRHVW